MQGALSGKTAWIVGGGSGIGLATAVQFGLGGATVIVSGRREAQLQQAVRELSALDITAVALALDVGSDDEVSTAHGAIARDFGPVDILVSSAGTNVTQRFWQDVSPIDFSSVVNVNLNGVVRTIHAVLPDMRTRRDGLIIVVSSWAGWRFSPGAGAAYSASKTALGALVETLNAQERVNGIRATHLCPGEVKTDILRTRPVVPSMEEQDLMLRPEDVGQIARYIAEAPGRICFNEVVITPTSNTTYANQDSFLAPSA